MIVSLERGDDGGEVQKDAHKDWGERSDKPGRRPARLCTGSATQRLEIEIETMASFNVVM